jgi:hypothetical protein
MTKIEEKVKYKIDTHPIPNSEARIVAIFSPGNRPRIERI